MAETKTVLEGSELGPVSRKQVVPEMVLDSKVAENNNASKKLGSHHHQSNIFKSCGSCSRAGSPPTQITRVKLVRRDLAF